MRELGERIRLARLRRSLPQDLLARRAGMSRETLRRIEAGDVGVFATESPPPSAGTTGEGATPPNDADPPGTM